MQQRQLRVGDLVEDYCPRERRVSDHAVVAMVDDEIRQTRCSTCDTEHDYRQAKVPPGRKRNVTVLPPKPPAGAVVAPKPPEPVEAAEKASPDGTAAQDAHVPAAGADRTAMSPAHEGHVHRRLIRAVLPRVEGEVPTRPAPEFTMHRAGTGARPPYGKPDRAGHGGGGQQRLGAKGGHGQPRHPGPRHDRGGSAGNTGGRGGHGAQGGHSGPVGRGGHTSPGGSRHGRSPSGGRGPGNKH